MLLLCSLLVFGLTRGLRELYLADEAWEDEGECGRDHKRGYLEFEWPDGRKVILEGASVSDERFFACSKALETVG